VERAEPILGLQQHHESLHPGVVVQVQLGGRDILAVLHVGRRRVHIGEGLDSKLGGDRGVHPGVETERDALAYKPHHLLRAQVRSLRPEGLWQHNELIERRGDVFRNLTRLHKVCDGVGITPRPLHCWNERNAKGVGRVGQQPCVGFPRAGKLSLHVKRQQLL
jgi:hypothetical protein